ncbi:YbhB/YbcL family Raf kinase inhibitor-like protein [Prauserella oleivorans]|uniref:YbhB/YbcL family Raf kinase inhibitor-like protein n=1 Tax=Prauserella oleivorans TaxID=1478153 RepID=A0ABW5WBF4_9PSEU
MTDPPRPLASGVELRSPAFNDGAFIPDRYAKGRENVSPPLEWTHVPDGARELVLLCEDPDAPGGTFVHWVLTGIRPDATGAPEGEPPEGANAGVNDFGQVGWGGPHPPVGDEPHRYFFRLYATDRPLELGGAVHADAVRAALEGHVIDTGTLVGRFGR